MKNVKSIFALLSLMLTSAQISHAMESEKQARIASYENELKDIATCLKKGNLPDETGLTFFERLTMTPPPAELSGYEPIQRQLLNCILTGLSHKADPNKINPHTGNTALADAFINHRTNGYLRAIVKEMILYNAQLDNITHDHRSLYHLIEEAQSHNLLSAQQLSGLSSLQAVVEHTKRHELEIAAQQKKQALKAYYIELEQAMRTQRPRARRVKTQGPAILGITEDSEENSYHAAPVYNA